MYLRGFRSRREIATAFVGGSRNDMEEQGGLGNLPYGWAEAEIPPLRLAQGRPLHYVQGRNDIYKGEKI
jgi:hypothetical protein